MQIGEKPCKILLSMSYSHLHLLLLEVWKICRSGTIFSLRTI